MMLKNAFNLVHNMGWRYLIFRCKHELLRRTGLLKRRFPMAPQRKIYFTLEQWRKDGGNFFWASGTDLNFPKESSSEIKKRFEDYRLGKLTFFNSTEFNIGTDYDWITNPDNDFKYDISRHWTEIADYSLQAGDIKFVWEKSRFSFLYDIIRYDYHFETDCASIVFDEIISWIKSNPVNMGPNYRCSQEISLRVLNWTFALYYYKDSASLTPEIFDEIQYAIYWQLHHVYNNINFSRIAVRNNHALTETLTLYLGGLLYPFVPDFKKWSIKGKVWFEQEINYQIYPDGTFLQFSMNYHRVVAQLLTWGLHLASLNNERFKESIYDRATQSLKFLRVCMDDDSGWLPNYGANDGALFFKLNDNHYRDYRPQISALANVLNVDASIDEKGEDVSWYGGLKPVKKFLDLNSTTFSFTDGGYYLIRDGATITFIRCGNHKDRPSQADNLHLDIWYKGRNLLIDAGSYKYNTDEETLRYFMGTKSHNTVMVNNKDQMLKGSRFIWYNWTQCIEAGFEENESAIVFKGTISAFGHIKKNIRHTRIVTKEKNAPNWIVKDELINLPVGAVCSQLWHLFNEENSNLKITAHDNMKNKLLPVINHADYSSLYAQRQKITQIEFAFTGDQIITPISFN